MAERYSKLFSLQENLYQTTCPVIIRAGALLLDTANVKVLAQLKFEKIQNKTVKSLQVEISCKDTKDNVLGDSVFYTYVDLNTQIGAVFGSQTPVYLPNAETRKFSVRITEVEFTDGTAWKDNNFSQMVLPQQEPITSTIKNTVALNEYHRIFGDNAKFKAVEHEDIWLCTCGACNKNTELVCQNCHKALSGMKNINFEKFEKESIYREACSLSSSNIVEDLEKAITLFKKIGSWENSEALITKCTNKIKQLNDEAEAQKQKTKKIAMIASPIAIVFIVFIIILNSVIIPNGKYNDAIELMDKGNYDEAIIIFEELSDYYDSLEKIKECKYQKAILLLDKEKCDEAIKIFKELGNYKDSQDKIVTCYEKKFGGSNFIVGTKETMPYLTISDGIIKKSNSGTLPTNLIIPDVFEGELVTSIGDWAFYNCTGLTSVTIGNKSIGSCAFSNCTGLTSVTIGNSVTSIGSCAFRGCTGLTSVTIGNSVTSIGGEAFRSCTGLTSIVIPNSVESIGDRAFWGCSGLTSIVIPNSVESIGDRAFWGCSGLTSITMPDSVTSIGSSAFSDCTGLTSITMPDSVTSIGSSAFSDCTGLTSIVIPNSVESIGRSAFSGCTGLTKINFIATAMNDLSEGNDVFYNAGKSGSGITVNIGANVTKIPAYLFYPYSWYSSNSSKITNVKFADNSQCTSIGDYAFYGCDGLTSIVIPNSVTSIGSSAFSDCTGLTSIVIPNSVESIGSSAFSSCNGLTSITIPDSVTSIGWHAFFYCTRLTSVTFEDTSTWYYTSSSSYTGGTQIDVTNPTTNATYLKSTYDNYYWYKL